MENVVYVLGAGFSAPLGIPTTKHFLSRSKDLLASDPEKFKDFEQVFQQIDALAKCQTYYSADLLNIEEILSILEMEAQLGNDQTARAQFADYLSKTIEALTPDLGSGAQVRKKLAENNFGSKPYRPYMYFVLNLFGVELSIAEDDPVLKFSYIERNVSYSIVSLNYDMVLESTAKFARERLAGPDTLTFSNASATGNVGSHVLLAKLHGSVHDKSIVPPTWSKVLKPEVELHWKNAKSALEDANHIRLLGYSLPETDSYIKYLLKAAVVHSGNLKSLDVICKDPEKDVRSRYSDFIRFRDFRFLDGDALDYISLTRSPRLGGYSHRPQVLEFNSLEQAHKVYFEQQGKVDEIVERLIKGTAVDKQN